MDKERRKRRQQPPDENLHEQKSRWSSSSAFNRILGNLERSIFGQTSASNGNISSSSSISSGNNSEKRRNQMTKQTSAKWTPSDGNNPSSLSQPISNANEHGQMQQTGADRISAAKAALKLAADSKLASEKSGKLTLTKCQQPAREQQQKYPVGSMDSNQLLASNKSLIPPPHASDEARSINRSILMGGGLALDIQSQSFETSSANSSALSAATLRRGGKLLFERQQAAESQHANRQNSSPASSARSLPVVGPKPGSQFLKQSSNLAISKDEEESGFSTYESRRSFLLNHHLQQQQQQHQKQQQDAQQAPNKDEKMFPNHFNNHTMQTQALTNRLYQPYISGNVHPSQQQSFNNIPSQFQMQRRHQQQVLNQHLHLNQDRVQTQPSLDQRFGTNGFPQMNPNAMNNISSNHPTFQQHSITSFNDSNHALFNQRLQERLNALDNGQQIYANAPPKPRRYQFYDSSGIQNGINHSNVHHQPTPYQRQLTVSSHNHQSHGSSVCRPTMAGFYPTGGEMMRSDQRQNINVFDNSQKLLPSYPPPPGVSRADLAYGQPLVKSKSSLGVDDLMRLRQSRISNNETNLQQNTQQPIYGYHGGTLTGAGFMTRHRPSVVGLPSQAAPGNLQRSKSVTHLLPEIDSQNLELIQRDHASQIGQRVAAVSSASINQLNLLGQTLTHPNVTSNQHIRTNQQTHGLINQVAQSGLNFAQRHIPVPNNWIEQQDQQLVQGGNFQPLGKAKSMAALNLQQNVSNRMIRQPPGHNFMAQQDASDCQAKPSLDDQIRHLLIGRLDNDPHRDETINAAAFSRNNNATFNQNSGGNNVGELVPSSSSNAAISEQNALRAWPGCEQGVSSDDVHLLSRRPRTVDQQRQQHQHQQAPSASGLPVDNDHINGSPIVATNVPTSSHNQALKPNISNPTGVGHLAAQSAIDQNEMGNHQQRQYKLQQALIGSDVSAQQQQQQQRQADANSQLIVDLTTPRVLARTQTTLVAADSQQQSPSQHSWSINQVGLPQFSPIAPMGASESKQAYQANESSITTPKRERATATPDAENKLPAIERTAPYYYSDLKSEEQQRALMNIVQQKSLSPPPQLLSRSTDQSGTRLAPKSATLHSSHARTLSENLAQRQRQRVLEEAFDIKTQDSYSAWATRNQSALKESSSASNIAKNIDELFDRPLLDQKSKMTGGNVANAAQSMLSLNNCALRDEGNSSHLSLDQNTGQMTNAKSISSGYCSGELRSKNLSKSKSLENISQQPSIEGSPPLSSKNLINPVYENIHRSSKLLSAINNAVSCSPDAEAKSLTTTKSNSDESMDSILGSSLDESESDSDIIDDIKISSTDNHLNDITNLIEQLKINHSKLAEEYKSTLVRISRTINSRTVREGNNDKVARRLHLLELKSKKCESRSKNQLALIQMMEKVLRQSKLRASSNGGATAGGNSVAAAAVAANRLSYPAPQPLAQLLETSGSDRSAIIRRDDSAVGLGKNHGGQASETRRPSDGDKNSSGFPHESPRYITATTDSDSNSGAAPSSSPDKLKDVPLKSAAPSKQPPDGQEIIKAIVTEKEVVSSGDYGRSVASMVDGNSTTPPEKQPTNGLQVINGSKNEQGIIKKNNAVTKRILDIEKRQNGCVQKQKSSDEQRSKNPFYSSSSSSSPSSSSAGGDSSDNSITPVSGRKTDEAAKPSGLTAAAIITSHQDDSRSGFTRGDDDDFIEFMCDDLGGRRSQFEASQFSASDFNTSTSNSESSTSASSAASDSMNSILPNGDHARRSATAKSASRRAYQESCEPVKQSVAQEPSQPAGGILKKGNRGAAYENNNTRTSPPLTKAAKHGGEGKRAAAGAINANSEKFKNVLGNVIGVDVCPMMNNLSRCSPVNNRA